MLYEIGGLTAVSDKGPDRGVIGAWCRLVSVDTWPDRDLMDTRRDRGVIDQRRGRGWTETRRGGCLMDTGLGRAPRCGIREETAWYLGR